jgi:hypothetical protein
MGSFSLIDRPLAQVNDSGLPVTQVLNGDNMCTSMEIFGLIFPLWEVLGSHRTKEIKNKVDKIFLPICQPKCKLRTSK